FSRAKFLPSRLSLPNGMRGGWAIQFGRECAKRLYLPGRLQSWDDCRTMESPGEQSRRPRAGSKRCARESNSTVSREERESVCGVLLGRHQQRATIRCRSNRKRFALTFPSNTERPPSRRNAPSRSQMARPYQLQNAAKPQEEF